MLNWFSKRRVSYDETYTQALSNITDKSISDHDRYIFDTLNDKLLGYLDVPTTCVHVYSRGIDIIFENVQDNIKARLALNYDADRRLFVDILDKRVFITPNVIERIERFLVDHVLTDKVRLHTC